MTTADFRARTNVSRETLERLEAYAALLVKWSRTINLVSRGTLQDLWTRHFLDSAQLYDLAPPAAQTWADLGSGGGFPGLVVASLAAADRPHLCVTCIESDRRKAVFLSTAIRELGLNAKVLAARIEAATPQDADIVSARALAPLDRLLSYADRHLASHGKALFLKGAGYRSEVEAANSHWRFDMTVIPSKTDADGAILEIGDIRRA